MASSSRACVCGHVFEEESRFIGGKRFSGRASYFCILAHFHVKFQIIPFLLLSKKMAIKMEYLIFHCATVHHDVKTGCGCTRWLFLDFVNFSSKLLETWSYCNIGLIFFRIQQIFPALLFVLYYLLQEKLRFSKIIALES